MIIQKCIAKEDGYLNIENKVYIKVFRHKPWKYYIDNGMYVIIFGNIIVHLTKSEFDNCFIE